ncbi:MAG: TIGR03915 family putative DNA repair protein [Allomuricauda sp.]
MKNSATLIYDGTFNGFLTTIFVAFEEKINIADIQRNGQHQNGLFSEVKTIFTHIEKAKRVWNGLQDISHNAITNIYFAYLSEVEGIELTLYSYIQKLLESKTGKFLNYSDGIVQRVNQLATSVRREKQYIEKRISFQLTKDNVCFANIEPSFDILPLISKHFRMSRPNQDWLIYDMKRKYGIYCNQGHVELVSLNLKEINFGKIHKSDAFLNDEYDYQTLWNDYIKNSKVKSLINGKLLSKRVYKRNTKYIPSAKEAV